MIETIAKLVRVTPTFSIKDNGSMIHDYFENDKESEGVVIVDGTTPAGILMRNDFYQKIGKQFGYSLYMKRDVTLLMKQDITCVEPSCDMAKFGFVAMNRNKDSVYDYIIIVENGEYAGTVSISEFLNEMSKTKEREIELLNQANEAEKLHRLEIEQKNAAIKNLLDHAGQGFLFFGSDLQISEEYSKECDEIFGFAIGEQNFLTVMQNFLDNTGLNLFQNAFENIFREENPIRNKVYLSILPAEIRMGERYIKAEYKVIQNQGKKSVMMILTDITQKKAMELKAAEEKSNIRLIIRAISSKSELKQAIQELREFVKQGVQQLLDSNQDPKPVLQQVFRIIHTMKGDFSLNSLHHTAAGLHILEDGLGLMLKRLETITMNEIREFMERIDCEQLLQEDIQTISEALGRRYFEDEDTYAVSKQRVLEIQSRIEAVFTQEEQDAILQLVDSLFYANMKDAVKDYNDYVQALAERLGKEIGEIKVSGEDVYVSRERYLPFIKSLVHVFRNMADHGIEDPEERDQAGKPELGEISCELEKYEDRFILSLTDDGKGINPEIIKKKAVEKGIYSSEEADRLEREQVLGIIFMDDFSTKDTVDMYSGRGVGMAAVRSEVEELGGQIMIDTEVGRYTCFRFVVPLEQ